MRRQCLELLTFTVSFWLVHCHFKLNNGMTKQEALSFLLHGNNNKDTKENGTPESLKRGKNIMLEKKEALGFLHSRHKRSLSEECDEGCSWEELQEYFEPNSQGSRNYMFNYNCGRKSCPAGCQDNNGDYSHNHNLDIGCKPHCDRKGNPLACDKYYTDDVQITKLGNIRQSIGTCISVDVCSNCNDGFYGGGMYCYMCGKIDNCKHRKCTDNNNNLICAWCDGEIAERIYWRAYTGHVDNRKSCQKTCSWRTDSTRCYPGSCASELAANCVCATNFQGDNCEEITDSPPILENHGIFYDDPFRKLIKIENDPNFVDDDHPTVWSNFVMFTSVQTKMSSKYLQPNVGLDPDHFVKDFKVGLIEMKTTLKLYRGGSLVSTKVQFCGNMDKYQPVDHFQCFQNFPTGSYSSPSWLPFKHDDKVIYSVSSTNGGYVKVQDRDRFPTIKEDIYFYNGKTTTREFEYRWDLVTPYHCSVTQGTSCTPFLSIASDITNNPSISFTWGGWADDLSGLSKYTYHLYNLVSTAGGLKDGFAVKESGILPNGSYSSSLTVLEPGVYSIHLSSFDVAGNHKTGRGLFFFDDQSVVTLHGEKTKCLTASKSTSYLWVVQDTNTVKISWPDRFFNVRHKNNRWLNPVLDMPAGSPPLYEDLYGNRTNAEIKHIHGIVEFKVSYEVYDPTLKDSRALTSLPESQLDNQYELLTVNWADGDRLNVTVQAFDILGEHNEESVAVYRDATPPVIENLWLTRGDRLNISVHSIEDFTKMTFEFEAYDDHSGLDTVSWKLYDNFDTYVEHGYEDIVAQGHAADLAECESKYGLYARGANCYCTPFMGCFHRHFQIKPEIKAHGGLKLNLDRGKHDSDYYIEISVTNKALLTTKTIKKITVDISPPHTGVIHDGVKGNPEIDYQQGMVLNAYWDQFFDRESGVFFYQYIVGTSCSDKNSFDLNQTHPSLIETYNTYGSHTASSDGTYYFTVVAYNRALEPSDPVCTDGVTIDSSVPGVREVVVKDSLITGGLVTDVNQTSYYILGTDRVRRLISNPTADCVSKATLAPDIDLYPLQRYENNSMVEVDGSMFCSNSSGAPNNIGLSLFKSSIMELSWQPIDVPAKVYDYEVGFSSTPGSSAPDILQFQSTKQHAHHRVMHGDIPDATQFYIIIKAISKSNVEGLTTLGPCFMDTTPPQFTGSITVSLSGDYLVASWSANAFSDSEELFDLTYEFAIGHHAYGTEIQSYKPLQPGATCTVATPPTCTSANISDLDWNIHGHHTYYVSIKVTNTAGLVNIQTSSPYIHDVQLPAEGVVFDIDTQTVSADIPMKDIEDVDFQTDTTSIAGRWSGFAHPHLGVTYQFNIGTTKGGSDVISGKDVGTSLSHKETGLSLTPYQKYFFTVIAVSSAGNTEVSSDGVTIVTENDVLSGVVINDGVLCNMTDLQSSHHDEDNRMSCDDDRDVQMSLNSLKAYWTVPDNTQPYTTDAFIAIQRRTVVGNLWMPYRDFVHVSTVFDISIDDLTLSPGIMYRVVLKLCAKTICFQSVSTDGVMVIANPPSTGTMTVVHLNTTVTGGAEKLMITFDKFYDPDIEDVTEKYDAIDKYEFTITDDSIQGKTYTIWTKLVTYTTNGNKISFEMELNGTMDFSRCKRFSIRGYNKVKLYSVISTEIKDCQAFNPILINPNTVIDAVGSPDVVDGFGKPVFLQENDRWLHPDQDYTPYKNLISAVWPSLRNRNYTYAIINARSVDVTTYYKQINQLILPNPCSHPDKIRCGSTKNEFMNEKFTNNELIHGTRYTVCVHADLRIIQRKDWIDTVPAVSACSDGIVVDLTPPKPGRLWIGTNPGTFYQTSSSDMYVNWDGFQDVEEFGFGPQPFGIKEFILGIGTSEEGNDVVAFENVGISQHKAIHQLQLQNGYQYYATLKAVDFANRVTVAVSEAVTVDMTPPVTSNNPITISNRHITSRTEIDPCWKDVFEDLESGIDYYMWSVGSEPGYTDKMPYMKVVDGECGLTDKNNPLDLQDGHYYYINVRAFNKAGLSSLATSWAYRVDTTPPTAGHVYDGDRTLLTGEVKDIDFQTETKVLHAYFKGFQESHSTIKDYYVSVGTCPQCEDLLPEQAIGITDEFTLENIHLGTGLRYYVTVTACNTADMCTTVTSDGVIIDNSAPTAGRVQDGVGFYDTEYQSMSSYISAKWYGFDDPQSGLDRFVWRAGTTVGGNDIVRETELHLTETTAKFNTTLGLPLNQRIYVTVRAYNKAGLWVDSTSNGFIVDTSPPVMSTPPKFSEDFGIIGLTQIYRTSMKVEWNVEDSESYIKRQFLSIKSHIGGEFMLSSQAVNGIARSYVFTGLDLHDGVTYYVTLISCNSAEICITGTSQGMFVDSTPPSRGMFAIKTDHAAEPDLTRHSHGWMTWSRKAVYLAWLGFSDVHSGIDHYKVYVGSGYMDDDLNKDKEEKYSHTTTNTDHGDEGYVQLFTVETNTLTKYDTLFISVWAVNGVGLRSHLIHSAFTKVPGGALDLIRRCDAISCEGHCVCAPQDQKCPYHPSIGACTDMSANNVNNLLLVKDSNGFSSDDQAVTASDNVLRGLWIVSQVQGMKPKWYEWSVGYANFNTPLGIYDAVEENVWQDASQLMESVFSTKPGIKLQNTISYSVFVRIWYSSNKFAVFKSNGIIVMGQAPFVTTKRGKAVIEKVRGTSVKDADFMQIGRPLTFDWGGKFLEAEETIQKYDIYLSTFPGGHDIMPITSGVPGTVTQFNMTGIKLTPGIIHYTNVIAYNYAGAHTTASSDGFRIDWTYPKPGMVYDGLGRQDIEYKNSSDSVESHWHGFTDTESGIEYYHWCVGTTTEVNNRKPDKTECGIMDWVNVGLHVSASRNVSAIPQGTRIYNKVYTTDNAGLRSIIVVSDGAIIDKTPPIPTKFVHADENIVENPSFENTGGEEIKWDNITTTDICMVSNSYRPLSWIPSSVTCMAVVSSDVNLARNGRSFLFLRGNIHQELTQVVAGHLYRVSFFSSHLPITDSVAANKEGFVQLGDDVKHVFLIYTKSYRKDGHRVASDREEVSWHTHTFYFNATQNVANITIGSVDMTTGILIDDLRVQEVNFTTGDTTGHVLGHVVYLHEWSSVHASWNFIDIESPIIDYTWAIGYSPGGTQLQPFKSAGLMNFDYNNNVTLVHNTYIYVTAIGTNAAGLMGVSNSDPILVDLTPPNIKYVFDGTGEDEEAWTTYDVAANWNYEDLESGIKICKWAIGYKPGFTDLLEYTEITTMSGYLEFPESKAEGYTVYTTLTCENNAGLTSSLSSNGVKISNHPPSTDAANVETVPLSVTEYSPRDMYQGLSNTLRMKWSGFTDNIGVETYKVKLEGIDSQTMVLPPNQEVLYTHFTKLSMSDDVHSVSLQAINKLFLRSSSVSRNFTVNTKSPQVDNTKELDISYLSNEIIVSWSDIFSSDRPLFYEISAGTYDAGANILQWQFTNQTSITFGIPASVMIESGVNVYVKIRAISVGGFYEHHSGSFKIP